MAIQLSFALHILGIIFWMGGLIVLSRFLRVFVAKDGESAAAVPEEVNAAARATLHGFVVPGCVIVLITGIYQLLAIGMKYYAKQGWFHAKTTIALILIGLTVYAGLQVSKAMRGEALQRKSLAIIHGGASGLTFVTLLILYLGRAA